MIDVWAACRDRAAPLPLEGGLLRVVESQEQIATRSIVNTLEQQALLEELLEATKPRVPAGCAGLHYLLATPFRYPPLARGSRFGSRAEPALFYGSLAEPTVLAESAFYRFLFWHGMTTPPPAAYTTQHTLFGAGYRSSRALRLQRPPFDEWRAALVDPGDYGATQRLGRDLREAGIEAFEFESARDPGRGINVALFTPAALAGMRPTFTQEWLCETAGDAVRFYDAESRAVRAFAFEQFAIGGELPSPAV